MLEFFTLYLTESLCFLGLFIILIYILKKWAINVFVKTALILMVSYNLLSTLSILIYQIFDGAHGKLSLMACRLLAYPSSGLSGIWHMSTLISLLRYYTAKANGKPQLHSKLIKLGILAWTIFSYLLGPLGINLLSEMIGIKSTINICLSEDQQNNESISICLLLTSYFLLLLSVGLGMYADMCLHDYVSNWNNGDTSNVIPWDQITQYQRSNSVVSLKESRNVSSKAKGTSFVSFLLLLAKTALSFMGYFANTNIFWMDYIITSWVALVLTVMITVTTVKLQSRITKEDDDETSIKSSLEGMNIEKEETSCKTDTISKYDAIIEHPFAANDETSK